VRRDSIADLTVRSLFVGILAMMPIAPAAFAQGTPTQQASTALTKEEIAAFAKLQVVIGRGDSAKRGPRLALTARCDHQHLASRKAHGLVEIDWRREILEVTGRLGDAQDPFQRSTGNTDAPACLHRHAADRLQPGGIRREGRDQHPPLRFRDLGEQPGMDALL